MKISIITPCFNSVNTIEQAIESVLIQKYKNFEHIVMDGGSTDGTVDILKKYTHLKWISEPDNGQVDAMHKGFAMSSGEIIGNLNADDYYLPGAFNAILPHFTTGDDFVMGKVEVVSEHNQTTWINDPEFELEKMLKHWAPNAFCVNPVGYFYRREVQEAIPFNQVSGDKHDLEFLLESAARYTIKKIDIVLGVFSHVMDAKTFREQMRPGYWRNENFIFVDRLLKQMDDEYQKKFHLERERGYQLRRQWTIDDAIRLGYADDLLQEEEFFFIPEDTDNSLRSRCGFVEFDRPASRGDWIIPVLTMGKVASKVIYHALKNLPVDILPAQVYHTHQINEVTIGKKLPTSLPTQAQLTVGLSLKKVFLDSGDALQWKFIAGVREPIMGGISEINKTQNMESGIINIVNYIVGHFDNQYKNSLGVDVYEYDFDHEKGYTIISKDNIELLIYRFEDLPRIFSQAIEEYLGIPDLKLPHINVAPQKKFHFDKKFLDEIYSSRMIRHFYTEEEIENFYRQWQKKPKKKFKRCFGLIYDIGMHSGQDTEFYLKKGFKIVAVDANPTAVENASKKFATQIADGQLVILNLGIVEKPTQNKLTFYINEQQTEWSSFEKKIATRDGGPYHCVEVNCTTLSNIINKYGEPYYVKIDVEGYDHKALKSLLSSQTLPRYVSVENGNMGMLKMLYSAGYDAFKYIQQNNIHTLSLPKPAKEGFWVEHIFPFGASGPFGEETLCDWKGYDDVRLDIARVWDPNSGAKDPKHDDTIHGWFDLHARLSTV